MAHTWGPWALSRGSHDSASFLGVEQECKWGWQKCEHVHGLQVISSSLLPCAKGHVLDNGRGQVKVRGPFCRPSCGGSQSLEDAGTDGWGCNRLGSCRQIALKKSPQI